ncbi:MAG: hypothetical protein KDD64_05715 [Bdellovibrionales bacterium]|nr:hypothetical protein [Bdellovibrionales bacterium]
MNRNSLLYKIFLPGSLRDFYSAQRRLATLCLLVFVLLSGALGLLYIEVAKTLSEKAIQEATQQALRLNDRLDYEIETIIRPERERPSTDYQFFQLSTNSLLENRYLSLSPLSRPHAEGAFPGLVGYFERDVEGEFHSPLLPEVDIDTLEEQGLLNQSAIPLRKAIWDAVLQAVQGHTFSFKESAGIFFRVPVPTTQNLSRNFRPEVPSFDVPMSSMQGSPPVSSEAMVATYALEHDLSADGRLILYRQVVVPEGRKVQGLVVEPVPFFDEVLRASFAGLALDDRYLVSISRNGKQFLSHPEGEASGYLLLEGVLPSPLQSFEARFLLKQSGLPDEMGPLRSTFYILLFVIALASYGLYSIGARHLKLAKERDNFVSAVSHELKTPITSIRMYGEMLLEGLGVDEKKREQYYRYIVSESERLSRLVGNVLEYAKLKNGEENLPLEEFSGEEFERLVSDLLSAHRSRLGEKLKIVSLPQEWADHRVLLSADAFSQVLLNLVENAEKFSKKSTDGGIDIAYSLEPISNRFVMTVRDFGPGIPADFLSRVFEPFFRGEDELRREVSGTGMGLTIARALARKMGGDLTVENSSPGARFTLILKTLRKMGEA